MRSLRGPGRLVPLSGRTRGSEDSRVNCPRGCKSRWVTSLRQTPCCCGLRTDGRPRGRPRSSRWGSWPTFADLAASQATWEAVRLHHPRRQLSFSAFNQPAGDGWERVACLPSGSGGRGSFRSSLCPTREDGAVRPCRAHATCPRGSTSGQDGVAHSPRPPGGKGTGSLTMPCEPRRVVVVWPTLPCPRGPGKPLVLAQGTLARGGAGCAWPL